jgi:uncharacterized membrane protein
MTRWRDLLITIAGMIVATFGLVLALEGPLTISLAQSSEALQIPTIAGPPIVVVGWALIAVGAALDVMSERKIKSRTQH